MYNCNQCKPNRLCPHYIISDSVTVVTVDGVDTLLIDLPAGTYGNCEKYCIIVRTLPSTGVMVNMPVAISIGGNTTTVYPLICGRTGLQAVGCQVSGRSCIKVCVRTNTTTGVFRAFEGLNSYCPDVLASLPVATTAAAPTPTRVAAVRQSTAKPKAADNVTISANTVTVNKEAK